MVFSTNQIESVLHKNISFKKITGFTRINGGYSKYTYKLHLDEKPFIFQIFKNPDDIPRLITIPDVGYLYPGGIQNYLKSLELLEDLKINKPQMIFIDCSKEYFKFDCVLNEFIEFDSYSGFEDHKKRNILKESLFEFGFAFGSLKKYKRHYPGDLTTEKNNVIPNELVLSVIFEYLDTLSESTFIRDNKNKIKDTMEELNLELLPRDEFYLIHGDFKPDNFRFNKNGTIYWIDFESLHYFDIEYEFSQFITPDFIVTNNEWFKKGYLKDSNIAIDENRLKFYQIYRIISQIANCSNPGVVKDDKEPIKAIIENDSRTLKALLDRK
jgi:hypothetical protein